MYRIHACPSCPHGLHCCVLTREIAENNLREMNAAKVMRAVGDVEATLKGID